jgi:hypothetical protein
MLVKRAAFDQVDGFDSHNFPMYCDDVDFSWRLRHVGYRVVHQPSAVVFHAKRLVVGGHVEPAATERYWTALARLLLATKWGRKDVVDVTTVFIKDRGDADELRALREFRARVKSNTLPTAIDEAPRTAVFIGTEYAEHRWA